MDTINVAVPKALVQEFAVSEDDLRQALLIGLARLRQEQATANASRDIALALLSTGCIDHLAAALVKPRAPDAPRQSPPALPGPPVSEILLAQRNGA